MTTTTATATTNTGKILPGTSDWLAGQLIQAKIVDRKFMGDLLDAWQKTNPFNDASKLATHLVDRGIVSEFQAKRSLEGDARKLCVGAYTISDILGNGSLGAVYRAVGRGDRKPYAVKILPKRDQWNTRLARRQADIFERLPPHPGLVPFVDVGTSQGQHYLVWPLTEGRTLEQVVREFGPMPPAEAARIAIKLAEILDICHDKKVLHGLVRPSNVLLDDAGGVFLIDFGIGAIMAENCEEYEALFDTSSAATALGRMLECAAPEIVINSSRWTTSCDQYSLGCTLYYAVTGRYPFPGGTFVDKIAAHQSKQPAAVSSLIDGIPVAMVQAIAHMMEKSPLDRFPKVASLIAELKPFAASTPVARPVPPPVDERTPPPKSRMVIQLPPIDAKPTEPVDFPLPAPLVKSSATRKMMGFFVGEVSEPVHVAVYCQGNGRADGTTHIQVVMHNPSDRTAIQTDIADRRLPLRLSGNATLKGLIRRGSTMAFHLHASRGSLETAKQSAVWEGNAQRIIYSLKLPKDCPPGPMHLKLYAGQGKEVVGQIDFILPVGTSSDPIVPA